MESSFDDRPRLSSSDGIRLKSGAAGWVHIGWKHENGISDAPDRE